MSNNQILVKNANNVPCPSIQLGTWQIENAENVIYNALKVGVRALDCAATYLNEKEVGKGIKRWLDESPENKREDLFITSKLWNSCKGNVQQALNNTLEDLQIEYLDNYLVHWPSSTKGTSTRPEFPKDEYGVIINADIPYSDVWVEMEKAFESGRVKAIGVSNLTIKEIDDMWANARIKPAFLQVEIHPRLAQHKLIEHAKSLGLAVQGYSPFGNANQLYDQNQPQLLDDPVLVEIAKKHNTQTSNVVISWINSRGIIALPKSVNIDRIRSNLITVQLEEDDINKINSLDKNIRYCDMSEINGNVHFADEKTPEQIEYQKNENVRARAIAAKKLQS